MNYVFPLRDHKGDLWSRSGNSGKQQRPSEGELADEFAHRNHPCSPALGQAHQWDGNEANAALEACSITYRRKANVHGFDGVKLGEADDVQ